jgi:phospholipase/lecithinase/hemolysin
MFLRTRLAAALAALLLAACGGGGDGDQSPAVRYDKLVSFGDSLSDVGTHKVGSIAGLAAATGGGGRWTTNSPEGGEIWTERLAVQLGVPKPCAAETGLQPNIAGLVGAPITPVTGCFSYAQGSARITSPLGPNSIALQGIGQTNLGLIAKPLADQMTAHLTASGGSYSGQELVVVLAGANDVFMELNFIGTPLGATDAQGAVVNVATAGATLGQLIKAQIVAKGAKRVLVLNMPDVAGTPFAKGLGVDAVGLIDTMVTQFNAQLAAQLQGVPEVRLADAYSVSKDQVANPAQYGLVNVNDVACGANRLGNTSLVCNASNTLAGVDVSRYQFADNVHPSAYGHLLLTQFAAKELLQAGWL